MKRLLNRLGLDRAVSFTIMARVIQAVGGIVIVYFISRSLTRVEQGYYYTFASILAIQVFFELGFSGVITQYAAHEYSHLSLDPADRLCGPVRHRSRLSSLLHLVIKWYLVISILFFVVVLVTGFIFFETAGNSVDKASVSWRSPWIIISAASAVNLMVTAILSFMDGIGKIAVTSKLRMLQQIVQMLLSIAFFRLGFKLYSLPIALAIVVVLLIGLIMTNGFSRILMNVYREAIVEAGISYKKEILPYQWKIAVSWISGYFIFQMLNPIIFASKGAIVAGRFGMTLAVLNGVTAISLSWSNTKVPEFSSLIAQGNYPVLDRVFKRTLVITSLVTIAALAVFGGLIFGSVKLGYNISDRFLPGLALLFLGLCTFNGQFVNSMALYLRCHKKEPYMLPSLVTGIVIVLYLFVLGARLGIDGLMFGYFMISCLSTLWCIQIFRTKRLLWH